MNTVFTGIDQDICDTAWTMVLPSISNAAEVGLINKRAGAIVVVDPRHPFGRTDDFESTMPVIFHRTIRGEVEDERYSDIAMAKAYVSYRTGLPSSRVQQEYPYLYEEGDTKWGGSTVAPGGLIVAFSGVQAVYDEMISEWMASAIRALCRYSMTGPGGPMNTEGDLLGD